MQGSVGVWVLFLRIVGQVRVRPQRGSIHPIAIYGLNLELGHVLTINAAHSPCSTIITPSSDSFTPLTITSVSGGGSCRRVCDIPEV